MTNGDGYCSIVGRQDERYSLYSIYVGVFLSSRCAAAVMGFRMDMLCKYFSLLHQLTISSLLLLLLHYYSGSYIIFTTFQ